MFMYELANLQSPAKSTDFLVNVKNRAAMTLHPRRCSSERRGRDCRRLRPTALCLHRCDSDGMLCRRIEKVEIVLDSALEVGSP
ncbi:hypothetical protein EVAR_21260_1 [Eumeta japonica]|uniref:Uncharacterized protein n=1 Tax=Eumeta variegata TaxID=151549 RepID=A0A4C1WP82_EUMVA|nr:hypothetical protein EVAR_21260_1 [Eumeta japonica]